MTALAHPRRRESRPTVRVVVLTWNGRAWLDRCLSALADERTTTTEVVVVDNASDDGSADFVRDRFPWVRVIALPANVGFARGNNIGAADATTDHLIFLNNDTEVAPGWLSALLEPVEADSTVGLVTSHIVFLDRPDIIDSAGDGYLRCGGAFKRGHGRPAREAGPEDEVFGACGAAFLIRRELFARLHGFDERFFVVYEDVDLSYRARLLGARVMYAAGAVCRHAGGASLGWATGQAIYYGQRNLEWTWIQNSPPSILWRSLPQHIVYSLAAGLAYASQGQFRPWLAAKVAAVLGLPQALVRRRRIQRTAVVDPNDLWALMEPRWVAVKRREKRFAFSLPAREVSPVRTELPATSESGGPP